MASTTTTTVTSTPVTGSPIKDYGALGNFFVELINRFVSKTPAFFNVIKAIGVVLTILGFIPTFFDVTLLGKTWDIIMIVAGIASFVVSQFAVENKTAKVATGELPLTATQDAKV